MALELDSLPSNGGRVPPASKEDLVSVELKSPARTTLVDLRVLIMRLTRATVALASLALLGK